MKFHRRCGDRVTLLNENSTAIRNFVEFNHGLVLSAEPLKDDVLFEVCIDRKVNVWNGSLEIGVTTLDPEVMELPATATKLRNTAWIMSGSSVVKDGVTLVNSYGPELDTLREGDCVGVMRTSKGELMFYINGSCLGSAASDMPQQVFAVIDLYGQCVQVSILHATSMIPIMDPISPVMTSLVMISQAMTEEVEEDPDNDDERDIVSPGPSKINEDILIAMPAEEACAIVELERLRFHTRCGNLVKLSNDDKTAERDRPLDDYNNGVVMTHRPLEDDELFEIRIDRLVNKWSGSIEVGVTTHSPETIHFPTTMTNMESGTVMMSGCKVLHNGQGSYMEYGHYNLDELKEGDTIGMMRRRNGELHYFINGVDQGVATDMLYDEIWGVIDLYGMTVKVSVVEPNEPKKAVIDSNRLENPYIPRSGSTPDLANTFLFRPKIEEDSLLFHTLRDSNVTIINNGKTAHRPNALEHYTKGIAMSNRSLKTNELFQVRLDRLTDKWTGGIEIGVTQHSSNDITYPFKMSSAISGTWALIGEDVYRNGSIMIPQYVRSLNKLREGDTVGVVRKDLGILHFYVNGQDQGPAAFNIPDEVYGIIDLDGRIAQATLLESHRRVHSTDSPNSTDSNLTVYPEICFHRVRGRNARLNRTRLTASRATVYSEFNDAVLFSARPLRESDMFELRIDKMVDCWIGSLEIGVTAICPDELEVKDGEGAIAGTATDLNNDTYILSGSAMMKDGECVRSRYPLDLDTLSVGSRVGMMWHADKHLHYYLDGNDMGKAWYVPHLNIYAVVDLYGQCTQVTILQNEIRAFNYNGCTNIDITMLLRPRVLTTPPPPYWSFSEYCGDNIVMMRNYMALKKVTNDPCDSLVFSSCHLVAGDKFEIKILECGAHYAGSFRIGVTDVNILNAYVNQNLPPSITYLPNYTAYIDGTCLKYANQDNISEEHEIDSVIPSLEWLNNGDRISLKKTEDSRVLIYLNSEELGVAFENVPDKVYVVIELGGNVMRIKSVTKKRKRRRRRRRRYKKKVEYEFTQRLWDKIAMKACKCEGGASTSAVPDNNLVKDNDEVHNDDADDDGNTEMGEAEALPTDEEAELLYDDFEEEFEQDFDDDLELDFEEDDESSAEMVVDLATEVAAGSASEAVAGPATEEVAKTAVEEVVEPASEKVVATASEGVAGPSSEGVAELEYEDLAGVAPEEAAAVACEMSPDLADEDTSETSSEEEAELSSDPLDPSSDQLEPSSDQLEPSSDQLEPSSDQLEHSSDQLEPLSDQLEPSCDQFEPASDEMTELASEDVTELMSEETDASVECSSTEPRPWWPPLPYTFHYVHGRNLNMYSSNTVAERFAGYDDAIAIVSQPLLRGHAARFRIDKVFDQKEWYGSANIGVMGSLPVGKLPFCALNLDPPVWVISSDMINANGSYIISKMGECLENVAEESFLSIHFGRNGDLLIEVDNIFVGIIGQVPADLSHVYPLIDLYGKVQQVSVLLHPYLVPSGTCLELAMMTANWPDKSLVKSKQLNDENAPIEPSQAIDIRPNLKIRAFSQDNLNENDIEPLDIQAGPSTAWAECPVHVAQIAINESKPVEDKTRKPTHLPLHFINRPLINQSLELPDNETVAANVDNYAMLQHRVYKSQSTHNFGQRSVDSGLDHAIRAALIHSYSLGSKVGNENRNFTLEGLFDTNIRHNDRYPEANDVDNLDTEIMDGLTLDSGNMPDLTDEQSSTIDESIRPDDYLSENLPLENLNYLNRIMCFDQDGTEGQSLESEWEVSGQRCEHLHLTLKFWNFLVQPYPELRQALSWGQVLCYCSDCQPGAQPPLAGWVRIERIDGVGASRRAFWHVARHTLGAVRPPPPPPGHSARRPPALAPEPCVTPPVADIWFDEEGKPHHTVLAIEIDIDGSEAENDRLLAFLIYLKSHLAFIDETLPSLDD